jgi:hypothetical protein
VLLPLLLLLQQQHLALPQQPLLQLQTNGSICAELCASSSSSSSRQVLTMPQCPWPQPQCTRKAATATTTTSSSSRQLYLSNRWLKLLQQVLPQQHVMLLLLLLGVVPLLGLLQQLYIWQERLILEHYWPHRPLSSSSSRCRKRRRT